MRRILTTIVFIALTLVSFAITFAGLALLLNAPILKRDNVKEACKNVRLGTPFAQATTELHDKYSFPHEQANFQKHEYYYSGQSGACTIVLNDDDTLVLRVLFDPQTPEFKTHAN
jgi:hypothetical protein